MIYRLTYGEISETFELNESYRHIIDSPQFKLKNKIEAFSYKLSPAPYGTVQKVPVKIEKQKVVGGALEWVTVGSEMVSLQQERCDGKIYNEQLTEIVSELPPSLGGFVRSQAYEHGHSSGYEECLSIARALAYELKEILPQLKKELQSV